MRRYRKVRRLEAVEGTRQRIVQATMELHMEQGILATTWEDIARRAGVALATVYRHFPTINELVPACGALVMATIRPPKIEDVGELLEGAGSTSVRVERVVREFCAFYERSGKAFPTVYRDCDKVMALQHFLAVHHQGIDAYVRAALVGEDGRERLVPVVCALLDYPVWESLRKRGIAGEGAEEVLVSLIAGQIRRGRVRS